MLVILTSVLGWFTRGTIWKWSNLLVGFLMILACFWDESNTNVTENLVARVHVVPCTDTEIINKWMNEESINHRVRYTAIHYTRHSYYYVFSLRWAEVSLCALFIFCWYYLRNVTEWVSQQQIVGCRLNLNFLQTKLSGKLLGKVQVQFSRKWCKI